VSETFFLKRANNTLNRKAGDKIGISVDGRLETPKVGEFVQLLFNQRGPWGPWIMTSPTSKPTTNSKNVTYG
jgi:hypothetical protein